MKRKRLDLDELAKLADKYRLHESAMHSQSSSPPYQVKYNGGRWHLVSIGGTIIDDPVGKIFDLEPDDAENLLDLLKALPTLIEQLQLIRAAVEPLRYAVREGLRGKHAHHEPISVGEGEYMYRDNEFYLELMHLQKLVTFIMDDMPPLEFPGYDDD